MAGSHEVRGSIPLGSTINCKSRNRGSFFGLGESLRIEPLTSYFLGSRPLGAAEQGGALRSECPPNVGL